MEASVEDIKPATSLAIRILALFLKKPKSENSEPQPTTDSDDSYSKVIEQIKGAILDLVNHLSLEARQNLADTMSHTFLSRGHVDISDDELMEFVMCALQDEGEENGEPDPDEPSNSNMETSQNGNGQVEIKTESQTVVVKKENVDDLPYIPVSVVGPEIVDLSLSESPSPQVQQNNTEDCEIEILEDKRAKQKEARKAEHAKRRESERLLEKQARTLRAMKVECPALYDLCESRLQTLLLPPKLSTYEQLFRWRHAYGETNEMEPKNVISTHNLVQLANACPETREEINLLIDIDDTHVVNEIYQILVQGADVCSAPLDDDDMRNSKCFNCFQRGHIEEFCPFDKVSNCIPDSDMEKQQLSSPIDSGSGVLRISAVEPEWLSGQELSQPRRRSESPNPIRRNRPLSPYYNAVPPSMELLEDERISRGPLLFSNSAEFEDVWRYRRNVWSRKWEPEFGSADNLSQEGNSAPNQGEETTHIFHYGFRGQEILEQQRIERERRVEAERLGHCSLTEWRWPSSHNWTPSNGNEENQGHENPEFMYSEHQDILPRPSDKSALLDLVQSQLQTHLSPRNLPRYELLFQWRKSHADIQGAMPKDVLSTTKLVELANAAPGPGGEGLALIRNTLGNERSILAGRIQEVLSTLQEFVKLPYGRICHNCFQKGHTDSDCPFEKNRQLFREQQGMRMGRQAQAHVNGIVPALNKCRINFRKRKPKLPRHKPIVFYGKNKWRAAANFREN